jgi:hypothetical protein
MLEELTHFVQTEWISIVVLVMVTILALTLLCCCNGDKQDGLVTEEGLLDNKILQSAVSKFWDSSTVSIQFQERRLNLTRGYLLQSDLEHHNAIKPGETNETKTMFKLVLDKLSHLTTGNLNPTATHKLEDPWYKRAVNNVKQLFGSGEEDEDMPSRSMANEPEHDVEGPQYYEVLENEQPWFDKVKEWIGIADEPSDERFKLSWRSKLK